MLTYLSDFLKIFVSVYLFSFSSIILILNLFLCPYIFSLSLFTFFIHLSVFTFSSHIYIFIIPFLFLLFFSTIFPFFYPFFSISSPFFFTFFLSIPTIISIPTHFMLFSCYFFFFFFPKLFSIW